ncbi:sigma E regulatory protein, MucB/RseB [Solimonas aquatica]|uniref:Sigma E regulatory protein, MucB/RseB n=1 Tax=Solimonas aquatica TaxID=489703 RepID=A0A1H9HC52_9GAMM|nr:MucB/RseB C-terminal domain-containing protein [Solimonas aquatica]SEQ59873.1 sigma E regulatory protein, MucB/RseB [Solimonas aquatica]
MLRAPLTLAVAGWSLIAAAADPSAADWLAKMSEAARSSNYQGVIVYQTQDRLETMRVVHRNKNGDEVERVQTLTGAPREILKQGNQVICLLPKDRKVTLELPTPKGLFPGLTPERVAQISQYYSFNDVGSARIAGRQCRGITISPRDQFRYGYEIWADAATAVPVKVNLIGRGNNVMEQLMFTEIEFPSSIPDSALQTELDPKQYQRVTRMVQEPQAAGVDVPDLQFANLPPGYRVTMRDVRPTSDGQGTVEHLLLSDGLSAISVFSARRHVPARMFQGASQIGALNAYGRVVGSVHVTVVGEAPSETVRLIGDNMQPGNGLPQLQASPQPQPPSR